MDSQRREEIKGIQASYKKFFSATKITSHTTSINTERKERFGDKSSPQSFCKLTLSLDSHLFFKFLSRYGWFTMSYQFQVYIKVNLFYISIYPLSFRVFSHIGHYRVLSRVPCSIQGVLIIYLFTYSNSVYANPNLLIYPSFPLSPGYC